MKIALDYDNTYTLDPAFWDTVLDMAQRAGHDMRIVTYRDDRYDAVGFKAHAGWQVYWTRGSAKHWWMLHFGGGWYPDIWVDDNPESLFVNSKLTPTQLAEFRRGDKPHE